MVHKYRVWDKGRDQLYIGLELRNIITRFAIPGSNAIAVEAIRERPNDMEWLQFTGFTHQGKEIYDKDIVRFINKTPGKKWQKSHGDKNYNDMVVSWNVKRGSWALYWKNAAGELCWASLSKMLDENHRVIGNVYQIKDLIA